jgi:hypothetical protein
MVLIKSRGKRACITSMSSDTSSVAEDHFLIRARGHFFEKTTVDVL